MALERIGRNLHHRVDQAKSLSRFDDLDDLGGEVGNGRENRPDDVVRVKTAFQRLGRLEEPERGFSGFIDRPLDGAIRSFQRANKLREDGFLRPGGPTQRTLQAQLNRIADARDEPPRHRIDFDFISELEGGQKLEGYVPVDTRSGTAIGNSGVTIATGVDLGQRSAEDIDRLDLPRSLRDKLKPYAGIRRERAMELLRDHPVRIAQAEADILDRTVTRDLIETLVDRFDRRSQVRFADLPAPVQTVIASVAYNHGPNLPEATPRFFSLASRRDFRGVVSELENFGGQDSPHATTPAGGPISEEEALSAGADLQAGLRRLKSRFTNSGAQAATRPLMGRARTGAPRWPERSPLR